MMREKELLSFRKLSHPDYTLSIHAHSSNRFFVRDIGNHQFTTVFKRNKAPVE